MTVYIPAFEPQHDEGLRPPLTNCNPASAAMLIDHWSYGALDTSDVPIRRASGIAPDQGMNFAAVNLGISRILPQLGSLRYSEAEGWSPAPLTWAQLRSHLANGGGACVGGNYSDLPTALRRWSPSFTGGHMVFVCDYREATEDVWWMDPMGGFGSPQAYAGERISLAVLFGFIWSSGKANDQVRVTAAHGFSSPRPTPPMQGRFPDVPVDSDFWDDIELISKLGLMTGYPDGTFRPKIAVTRGQLAAVLRRLLEHDLS